MSTAHGIGRLDGRRTILCIEDDPARLALIERALSRRATIQLVTATDALAGTRMARQHVPDLVLLDLNVGGMGGEEVLARLHADPATRAVPVVVVGSGASASLCQRLIARGAQSYLPMPFHAADLCRVVEYALSAPSRAAA